MSEKNEVLKEKSMECMKEILENVGLEEVAENHMQNENTKEESILSTDKPSRDIQVRLRRIQGQVKGIEKMIGSETCCKDILVQVAAVRSAMNKVGGLIIERYAKTCLLADGEDVSEEKIQELVSTLLMFLK